MKWEYRPDLLHHHDTLIEDDTLEYTVIVTAASADFFKHVSRLVFNYGLNQFETHKY